MSRTSVSERVGPASRQACRRRGRRRAPRRDPGLARLAPGEPMIDVNALVPDPEGDYFASGGKFVLAVRWRRAQPISRSDTAEICPVQRPWILLSLTGHFTGRISRDTLSSAAAWTAAGVARWGARTTRALPTPFALLRLATAQPAVVVYRVAPLLLKPRMSHLTRRRLAGVSAGSRSEASGRWPALSTWPGAAAQWRDPPTSGWSGSEEIVVVQDLIGPSSRGPPGSSARRDAGLQRAGCQADVVARSTTGSPGGLGGRSTPRPRTAPGDRGARPLCWGRSRLLKVLISKSALTDGRVGSGRARAASLFARSRATAAAFRVRPARVDLRMVCPDERCATGCSCLASRKRRQPNWTGLPASSQAGPWALHRSGEADLLGLAGCSSRIAGLLSRAHRRLERLVRNSIEGRARLDSAGGSVPRRGR